MRLWREDHGKVAYERSIEVKLEEDAPRLHLVHGLRNLSSVPLNAAPWSISVLPMGAKVRIPLSKGIITGNELLPNRSVSFWPYDNLRDARLSLQNDYVELSSNPQGEAFKIGVYSSRGWAAAQVGEWLLVKRFDVREPQNQPDFGANVEAYTNKRFVEIELVGELRNLEQGEFVIHTETWEILHGNLDDLDENGNLPGRK